MPSEETRVRRVAGRLQGEAYFRNQHILRHGVGIHYSSQQALKYEGLRRRVLELW